MSTHKKIKSLVRAEIRKMLFENNISVGDSIELSFHEVDNSNLTVSFRVYPQDEFTQDDYYRSDTIDLAEIEAWAKDNEHLTRFQDAWDYSSESHYTTQYEIPFSHYLDDGFGENAIVEFLEDYYKTEEFPPLTDVS